MSSRSAATKLHSGMCHKKSIREKLSTVVDRGRATATTIEESSFLVVESTFSVFFLFYSSGSAFFLLLAIILLIFFYDFLFSFFHSLPHSHTHTQPLTLTHRGTTHFFFFLSHRIFFINKVREHFKFAIEISDRIHSFVLGFSQSSDGLIHFTSRPRSHFCSSELITGRDHGCPHREAARKAKNSEFLHFLLPRFANVLLFNEIHSYDDTRLHTTHFLHRKETR